MAPDEDSVEKLFRRLEKQFWAKHLGEPKHFLELDLHWEKYESVSLSQEQLINKLLGKTGIDYLNR